MHSFYRQLSQSKFALCPSGNGFDTHRFWQALYLGCLPVTRRCNALKAFEGMGESLLILGTRLIQDHYFYQK